MIDCNICKNKNNNDVCTDCIHGELFERNVVSEPKKISVRNGKDYCGHCGYISDYARKILDRSAEIERWKGK